MPSDKKDKLRSIDGVEIFSAGRWNEDDFTVEDLDEMVKGFNDLKATLKPYLKLGHDDDQKLLQTDGYPAAGWVGNLYRKGEKLLADFIDLPEKIYKLIENRAYRKVSSEIYFDAEFGGKIYKRLLSGVALLGTNTPAVTNLNDILSMYGVSEFESLKSYTKEQKNLKVNLYSFDKNVGEEMPSEKEIKLEAELAATKAQLEELKDKKASFTKEQQEELARLQKFEKEAKEKLEKAEFEKRQAQADKFVAELESQNLCTKSMRDHVKALLSEDKKEYSLGEKKLSKQELIKETFKLLNEASKLNFTEETEEGDKDSDKEAAKEAKIEKYMKEHKVSYSDAYRAIEKEGKE